MTQIEGECLNRIRFAIKQYLRWEWDRDPATHERITDAMDYLMDRLWQAVDQQENWIFLKTIYENTPHEESAQ